MIKKDDIEDTEEVGSSDPELEEEAAFPILNDLIDRIQLTAAPLESTGASVSVYAENLSDGARASVNSSQMPAASLIKLYIAGCVYEQMDFVKEQEVYAGETEELLRLMITVSDNDAANELVRKLGFGDASAGMEVVNEFCRLHGFADTHMGRLLLAPNDMDDNYTSVNDCGKFLREMNGNVLVGSEKLLDLMRQQERTGKIPAGVPENIETANKTGELSDVENDAAIIFGENGAYTVCVMMSGLSDTSAARSVIREISAQIYEYMCP
ncbi:hypothetical protein HMPREF0990_01840 [Lachnospiraceae bacterium 1_1_57FAA]|nr:hypothetical protein HMPREF0990_01840 [Lachnospiraceae bacterium 1_1_57FAA]